MNNALLDTYQLKSLDGLLESSISHESVKFVKRDGKLYLEPMRGEFSEEELENLEESEGEPVLPPEDNFAVRDPYDKIIRCMGFKFDTSIFQ